MTTASPGVGARPQSEMSDVIVRPAAPDEAADLFRLITDNLETGHLLPRPLGEVVPARPEVSCGGRPNRRCGVC